MTTIEKIENIASNYNASVSVHFNQRKIFVHFPSNIAEKDDYGFYDFAGEAGKLAKQCRNEILKEYYTAHITFEDAINDFSLDTLAFEINDIAEFCNDKKKFGSPLKIEK